MRRNKTLTISVWYSDQLQPWPEEKFENIPISPILKVLLPITLMHRFYWWLPFCIRWFRVSFKRIADKKWGKGKDKIDDEEIAFHRMVSKVRESRFIVVTHDFVFKLRIYLQFYLFISFENWYVSAMIFGYGWISTALSVLITCPGRDLGVSYWVINMFRCKMFLGNVEVIFMEEAVLIFALLDAFL